MNKGVPFDVAMNLPVDERVAYCIIFGELDGGKFDWAAGRWEARK